jgi:hypothetical protein
MPSGWGRSRMGPRQRAACPLVGREMVRPDPKIFSDHER